MKSFKCRNQACPLNENLKCGSPCRNREDFTCANKDAEKDKPREVDFMRNGYPVKLEHDEIEKYINERSK